MGLCRSCHWSELTFPVVHTVGDSFFRFSLSERTVRSYSGIAADPKAADSGEPFRTVASFGPFGLAL